MHVTVGSLSVWGSLTRLPVARKSVCASTWNALSTGPVKVHSPASALPHWSSRLHPLLLPKPDIGPACLRAGCRSRVEGRGDDAGAAQTGHHGAYRSSLWGQG